MIPPSPPVFGYEERIKPLEYAHTHFSHIPIRNHSTPNQVEVVAAAGSGMGLYLMFGCICCTLFGGRSMRARRKGRWLSNGLKSVDGVLYASEESRREGEFFDHIAKGQLPARAHNLVVEDTAAPAAHTIFGTDFARALFATPATPSYTRSSAGTSGFTFGSLLSDGKDADAPPTPHKLRFL